MPSQGGLQSQHFWETGTSQASPTAEPGDWTPVKSDFQALVIHSDFLLLFSHLKIAFVYLMWGVCGRVSVPSLHMAVRGPLVIDWVFH